jgi:hypothetical protein
MNRINHIAVWVLVAIHQIIGALWFSSVLFGNVWMDYLGRQEIDFQQGFSPMPFIYSIIGSILMNYILAWLIIKLAMHTFFDSVKLVAIIWFGFIFFQLITFDAFALNPIGLSLVNAFYSLVLLLVSAVVLSLWKKKEVKAGSI